MLSATYKSSVDVAGLPAHVGTKVKESFAVASHMSGPVAARANDAFVSAMHVALVTASGVAFVAAIGVALLLARSSGREPEDAPSGNRVPAAPEMR